MNQQNIRNFCIIAHIDHGKSTLADRLLEICHTVPPDKMKPQLLDSLALERERGITIKLAPVRLSYTLNFELYTLNLIDTPGHVDFSYEVSRSLAAVEGAILLVDATAGIQAQTLAHGLSALNQGLTIIPLINKIDLQNADVAGTKKQIIDTFGFREDEVLLASGKTGQGVREVLQAVIARIPSPNIISPEYNKSRSANATHFGSGNEAPLRALVFDSFFDSFKGVVAQVRIVEGQTPKNQSKIVFLGSGAKGQVVEVGIFAPEMKQVEKLLAGEIGYIATGIKTPDQVRVGDTISTPIESGSTELGVLPLPGYKQVKPMVFVGLYPINQNEYQDIKEALQKFILNDPSFTFEPEHSQALGSGFRCGFLGLLHAEVVQERLSQEYNVNLLATVPSVEYLLNNQLIDNPSEVDPANMKSVKEPWVSLRIFVPQNYIGAVMSLAQDKRGKLQNRQHFGSQVELSYQMPLAEMVTDFYDRLKSVSSGFASLDWEFLEFREVDAVRVDILVGGERLDALSSIIVQSKAANFGRKMVEKLKEVLPRQNFAIALQAAIGGTIIARETISPFRKDVTAKLYGGDRTRKDKLLEAQKKGKKRMKMVGRVEIPQEAFLSMLKS